MRAPTSGLQGLQVHPPRPASLPQRAARPRPRLPAALCRAGRRLSRHGQPTDPRHARPRGTHLRKHAAPPRHRGNAQDDPLSRQGFKVSTELDRARRSHLLVGEIPRHPRGPRDHGRHRDGPSSVGFLRAGALQRGHEGPVQAWSTQPQGRLLNQFRRIADPTTSRWTLKVSNRGRPLSNTSRQRSADTTARTSCGRTSVLAFGADQRLTRLHRTPTDGAERRVNDASPSVDAAMVTGRRPRCSAALRWSGHGVLSVRSRSRSNLPLSSRHRTHGPGAGDWQQSDRTGPVAKNSAKGRFAHPDLTPRSQAPGLTGCSSGCR